MARLKSRHKETPFFRSLLGLIPFPKLQNSCSALSFPGVRGGGSKLPHSCGLVASKENAGLPGTKRRDPHKSGESPAPTCKPTRKQTGESASLQSEDGGVKPPLQRLDQKHENQQNQ